MHKLLFVALLRVRIVGRDDEDRLRSFARRYLALWNLLWQGTFLVGATPRGRPLPRHFAMIELDNRLSINQHIQGFVHPLTVVRIANIAIPATACRG